MRVLLSFYTRARRPTTPNSLQNGSQGDFPTRGRAEPLKPNRFGLQAGLCRREAARVNNNQGRSRCALGWRRGPDEPGPSPTPGPPGFPKPTLAQPAGRQPGTDSPPGPSGRVQPAKFLPQGRASVPARATCAAREERSPPCSRKVKQLPRAPVCFPRCINSARERRRLPSRGAPAGRHAPRGNGPTLTLAAAMLRPGCGRLQDPLGG